MLTPFNSVLSLLRDATSLDYYPLRATICEHLLEPIYNQEDSPETQRTILACASFLNKEQPHFYLKTFSSSSSLNHKRRLSTFIPDRIIDPVYPLLTHIDVWSLNGNILQLNKLVRAMDAHPTLPGPLKDEAYLRLWQHLLREGLLLLDGNHQTPGYWKKRELLYKDIVTGMGVYGKGSMQDFYMAVAQKVWRHPDASPNEKHYVLLACQQTLLRLFFKSRGLGPSTVEYFVHETQWPIPLPTLQGDLDVWAAHFLSRPNPIPESMDDAVDLSPWVEGPDLQERHDVK